MSIREYFSFSLIIAGLQPEKVEINLRLSVPDSSDACSDLVSDIVAVLIIQNVHMMCAFIWSALRNSNLSYRCCV